MALTPDLVRLRWTNSHRLVPSRFPTAGLFDRVASAADLDAIIELEGWTNDRLSAELGILHIIPREEWVTGRPMASVVMAAFCHPHTGGGRFSGEDRGAWYAARRLDTALAESIYRRRQELDEVGVRDARMEMRLYWADFRGEFHDVRPRERRFASLHDPDSYARSQHFARRLFDAGSHGIVYRSVRHPGGECLACFRPADVVNVRVAGHYEYRWEGSSEPFVQRLG